MAQVLLLILLPVPHYLYPAFKNSLLLSLDLRERRFVTVGMTPGKTNLYSRIPFRDLLPDSSLERSEKERPQ
jgi:hypothetical protein